MNYKASKVVLLAAASAVSLVSTQVWSADANGRMDQLEARVLKLEAASNQQSGMMKHMMEHKQPMSEKNMGGPMGTMPQPAAPMPPADGGMGHM